MQYTTIFTGTLTCVASLDRVSSSNSLLEKDFLRRTPHLSIYILTSIDTSNEATLTVKDQMKRLQLQVNQYLK